MSERDFRRALRTTGIVSVDETRTSHVHTKVRGWVDGVAVRHRRRRRQAHRRADVGGLVSLTLLTLLVIPRRLRRLAELPPLA